MQSEITHNQLETAIFTNNNRIYLLKHKLASGTAMTTWLCVYKHRVTSSVYSLRDSSGVNCCVPFPNGDRHGEICFLRGGVLRPIWLLQSAWILVPRVRQRENQERNRAEHKPPLPRRTREEDSRKISQQRNETQENQELVVLMAFLDVHR